MMFTEQLYNMNMKTVFIVAIALFTYAMGTVLARRMLATKAGSAAHPFEALLVTCALSGIAYFQRTHHTLAYFICGAVGMFLLGYATAWATRNKQGLIAAGMREFKNDDSSERPTTLWKQWINFSRAVVDYEFRLLLVASYLLIVGPFAIAFRLFSSEPAGLGAASTWTSRSHHVLDTIENAHRPF